MKIRNFSLAGAILAGVFSLWEFTFGIDYTVHIYNFVVYKDLTYHWAFIPLVISFVFLFLVRKKVRLFEYALRPLWLNWIPFIYPDTGTAMLCLVLAVFAWSAFRLGNLLHHKLRKIPAPDEKFSLPLVCILTCLAAVWSFYLQTMAFKSLYLIFGDWGQYAECYQRLAHGTAPFKEWLCTAGHFNALVNVVMTLGMLIKESPYTIFAINALVIASAIPLSWQLAKSCNLKKGVPLLCAFLAAIYPIFTRQSTCLFYGFHPIVFFMPFALGFFIARSKNSLPGMIVCAALSLLVQETVAIFWIGWGLYLFAVKKKYLAGSLFACAMAAWFAFLVLVVQPWGGESAVYAQSFRYAALGSSPVEIALSPVLRPGAFWSAFLSPRNLVFSAIILIPAGVAALAFPGLLIISLPLLGGFFIQTSDEIKTPLLQYGVELGTLCWAAAIINMGRLANGEKSIFKSRGKLFYGTCTAVVTGGVIGYFFFGYGYKFGLYPKDYAVFKEDFSNGLQFLKKHLPENPSRILVAQRLRAHFMFDYNTAHLTEDYREGDWLVLDLHDPVFEAPGKTESLRRKLYLDPRCRPVTYVNWFGKTVVLVKITAPDSPVTVPFFKVTEEHFKRAAGVMLNSGHDFFQCKYDGRNLYVRLAKKANCDYNLTLKVTYADGREKKFDYVWLFGLMPAWAVEEGTLWSIPLEPGLAACGMSFTERPESSLSAKPAKANSATLPEVKK